MERKVEKLLLTVPESAARLGLGRSKFYELLQSGQIKPVRIGRAVRIQAAELERFVERLQREQDGGDDPAC